MSDFKTISQTKDFKALDAIRGAALIQIAKQSKALEKFSKDRPSLRSFQRIEAKIDSELLILEEASREESQYFIKEGGDPMDDPDFDTYRDIQTNVTGEAEILRESVRNVLKDKGLLQKPVVEPSSQSELLKAIKILAESQGQHATAIEKQAAAALHHHNVPLMDMPIFNPSECRTNPMG